MTINLEQAKRLWELGVRKKSRFVWFTVYADNKYWDKILYEGKLTEDDLNAAETILPAYNAEELISMMQGDYEIRLNADKTVDITVWYERYKGYDYFKGNTLTEALCNKLIYDIENGIITPEEINK